MEGQLAMHPVVKSLGTSILAASLFSCSNLLQESRILSDINLTEGEQFVLAGSEGPVSAAVLSVDGDVALLDLDQDGMWDIKAAWVEDGSYAVDLDVDQNPDVYLYFQSGYEPQVSSYSLGRGASAIVYMQSGIFCGFDFHGDGDPDITTGEYDTMAPLPPTGLSVLESDYFSLRLSWPDAIDPADPGTGNFSHAPVLRYQLYIAPTPILSMMGIESAHEVLSIPEAGRNTAVISGLSPGSTYHIALGVFDTSGNFAFEPSLSVSTLTASPPSLSDVNVVATPISSTEVDLDWVAATDVETPSGDIRYFLYASSLGTGFNPYDIDGAKFQLIEGWPKTGVDFVTLSVPENSDFWAYLVAEDSDGFRTTYNKVRVYPLFPVSFGDYHWDFEIPDPFYESRYSIPPVSTASTLEPGRSAAAGEAARFSSSPMDTGLGFDDASGTGEEALFGSEYSFSFWLKSDGLPVVSTILFADGDTDPGNGEDSVFLKISELSDHRLRVVVGIDGMAPSAVTPPPVSPGVWTMITITRESDKIRIYYDGLPVGDLIGGQLVNAWNSQTLKSLGLAYGDLIFGGGYPGEDPFSGVLDDISWYSYSLSEGEIFNLWNDTRP
jgi:hypothetical protein